MLRGDGVVDNDVSWSTVAPRTVQPLMMRTDVPTDTIDASFKTLWLSIRKQPWLTRMPIPNFLFEP